MALMSSIIERNPPLPLPETRSPSRSVFHECFGQDGGVPGGILIRDVSAIIGDTRMIERQVELVIGLESIHLGTINPELPGNHIESQGKRAFIPRSSNASDKLTSIGFTNLPSQLQGQEDAFITIQQRLTDPQYQEDQALLRDQIQMLLTMEDYRVAAIQGTMHYTQVGVNVCASIAAQLQVALRQANQQLGALERQDEIQNAAPDLPYFGVSLSASDIARLNVLQFHPSQMNSEMRTQPAPYRYDDEEIEDTIFSLPFAAGVFDGVGSSYLAKVASQLAKQTLLDRLSREGEHTQVGLIAMISTLHESLLRAHNSIRGIGEALKPQGEPSPSEEEEEYIPPQTTGTVMVFLEAVNPQGEQVKLAIVANIGDSRAYLARNGNLTRLTQDADILRLAHYKGDVGTQEDYEELVREMDEIRGTAKGGFDARWFLSQSSKTYNTLGQKNDPLIEIGVFAVGPDDEFLLGTDGLEAHNASSLTDTIRRFRGNPKAIANGLMTVANERTTDGIGKDDDMAFAWIS